jgi:predicted DNA-binding protein
MEETKVTTVRMSAEQAGQLEAVAKVDDIPVSEAIRQAISTHIAERRKDQEFRERLRRRLDEDRVILEKLAE